MLPKSINFTEKLNSLLETVKHIITHNEVSREKKNECVYDIYLICVSLPTSFVDELYNSTKLLLMNHVLELSTVILARGTENLLQNYYSHWEKYSKGVKHLHLLYYHLNKFCTEIYKSPNDIHVSFNIEPELIPEKLEVGKLGFYMWEHNIIIPFKDRMLELLFDETDKARHNLSMTTSLNILASIIDSLIATQEFSTDPLKLYQSYFEQPFLEKSSEYFKDKAARLLQESTVSVYITKTLEIFKIEKNIIKPYLHESTYDKVHKLCIQHMIDDHLELLNEECKAIIKKECSYDIHNMYLLLSEFKDKHGLNRMVDIFEEHVQLTGIECIKSLNEDSIYACFVNKLFVFYHQFKILIAIAFENDEFFDDAFRKAFTKIINYTFVKNQPSKSPEYLSKFCDHTLNNLPKDISISEEDMDQMLLFSITILKHIDNKDVFQNFYQLQLANRLIYKQFQSMDREKKMIDKLKIACGVEFTNKMDQMFTDIILSDDLNTEFNKNCIKKGNQLNVTFSILKTGAWPLRSPESPFNIPIQVLNLTQNFEGFYKNKFDKRKLTWCFNSFQGELKLNYLHKEYMVIMPLIPITIMLLFEEHHTLKKSEICNLLQLKNENLHEYLNSLVKFKLLLVDDDNVYLNMKFTQRHSKLRIRDTPLIDKLSIQPKVDYLENDRLEYTQAAIVRIMKARKVLRHYQLVNEILTIQPKIFSPTVSLIKKSVEKLIEKGFLERTQNSLGYIYVE